MNWEEMKNTWSGQELPAWPAAKIAALENGFVAKQRKLRHTLFWRDIREAAAGVLVAVIFARTGWQMGAQGWPVALAVIIVLGLSGFFVRERIRARRTQPPLNAALLVRLDAEIAEQRRQRHLLSHVAGWYLAPILSAGAVFGATVLAHIPVPLVARLVIGVLMIAIFAACGVATIWLNRRVVRRVIEPQLRELEASRESLISFE